jgi:hypothetical protein
MDEERGNKDPGMVMEGLRRKERAIGFADDFSRVAEYSGPLRAYIKRAGELRESVDMWDTHPRRGPSGCICDKGFNFARYKAEDVRE